MRENIEADIWYIGHSGFAVKIQNNLLVFDYYREMDLRQGAESFVASLLRESGNDNVFVFVSHSHPDHFNPGIFGWQSINPATEYILSYDVKAAKGLKKATIVYPGYTYRIKELEVEVFGSTDEGVSFLVSCDGKSIFHAGDLNWWHWKGEPEQDNLAMETGYKKQIDLLGQRKIDVAFIPVDPRLEEFYHLGLLYFMETVGSSYVFPMHFWEDYSIFDALKSDLPAVYQKNIVEIKQGKRHFRF